MVEVLHLGSVIVARRVARRRAWCGGLLSPERSLCAGVEVLCGGGSSILRLWVARSLDSVPLFDLGSSRLQPVGQHAGGASFIFFRVPPSSSGL